jgi:hypothetical protein
VRNAEKGRVEGANRAADSGPPPMKWSDSKYGYATEEDCNGEEAQA